MAIIKRLAALFLALGILLPGWEIAHAQQSSTQYFPETGHWITGEFLDAYQKVKEPLLVYGYPITDAFQDPLTGLQVQYFQRARFELHLEAEPGQRVQQSSLGSLLYEPGQPVAVPAENPACRYFPQQKHSICYAFLDFFDKNGGLAQFGYPVSDIEIQDNLYVQYFERARFEWHPELPAGQRVALADLGRIYFDTLVGEPSLLKPNPGNNIPRSQIELQARAFVVRALVSSQGSQTVYVVVQDQYLRPIPQANVAITIDFPAGGEERYRLPLTNEFGITKMDFSVGNQPADQVTEIEVEASQSGLLAQTSTWFRTWW